MHKLFVKLSRKKKPYTEPNSCCILRVIMSLVLIIIITCKNRLS